MLAIAYYLTASATYENGNNIYSQEEKATLLFFYGQTINNLAISNRRMAAIIDLGAKNTVLTLNGLE